MASKAPVSPRSRWRFRSPPRGQTPDQYLRCPAPDASRCAHGAFCVRAHSDQELQEWVARFDPQQLLAALGRGAIQARVEADWRAGAVLPVGAKVLVSPPTAISTHKSEPVEWRVAVTAGSLPEGLGLLDTGTRPQFRLAEIRCPLLLPQPLTVDAREWTCADKTLVERSSRTGVPVNFEVTVVFSSDVYGSYQQQLALVFPHHAPMLCWLKAHVTPQTTEQLVEELRDQLTISEHGWTDDEVKMVPFSPDPSPPDDQERQLLAAHPPPSVGLRPPPEGVQLTVHTYSELSGTLLRLEEAARTHLLNSFNVSGQLQLLDQFVLPPDTTIHHATPGELFARLELRQELSADTAAGRLITDNCQWALVCPDTKLQPPVSPVQEPAAQSAVKNIYEVLVTAKAKREIYLRLSSQMVSDLSLSKGGRLPAAIRFQASRQWSCEMQEGCQLAAEKAGRLLFPETAERPVIPWNPASHWRLEDEKLNPRQKEAINAMTAVVPQPLPPVLVLGPYGTGKTYTMAHGVKHILTNLPEARILICTHSNSAADLYIREYLAGYLERGLETARPLRVYYRRRRLGTVHPTVRPFTLPEEEDRDGGQVSFRRPTEQDVLRHRVVVCTLSITKYLTWLDLPEGTFSHILVDEAAQALEWEAARALSLAGPETRVVLAGDHLQLAPYVYSEVCRDRGFQCSLLERLQLRYGADFPCAITLHENYRSHADIVQLTSELFYGRLLRCRAHPGRHPSWPPVSIFSCRGTAHQAAGQTGYYNDEEVYEVADRVTSLCDDWPDTWGPLDQASVCVVSAYAEQVQKIRSELRNRKLSGVTVERLLNVQGKEFRAVFVSTVRTRESCPDPAGDYRFLSDCKLLNTAVTRARSLIAIVGCPETLCSVGACSRYWLAVVEFAAGRGGLFGTTESDLRSQLTAAELHRLHGLNPLAPTFRPQPPGPAPAPPAQPVVVPLHPAALQQAQQPPQSPWLPAQQLPSLRYMPGMPHMSPGYLSGQPLLLGPPALPPLVPYPPVPALRPSNGYWGGQRLGAPHHQPPQQQQSSAADEDALFEMISTTDMLALLPPDVNLHLLLEDTGVQQEWAGYLAARRGPLFARLFTIIVGKLRPRGPVFKDRPDPSGRKRRS